MRIRDFEVPEAVVRQYDRVVEGIDEDYLVDFARQYPAVAAGFRPNRSVAQRIRQAILREIKSGHKSAAALIDVLRDMDDTCWMLESLVEARIDDAAEAIAAAIGPERFAAAALLDPRDAVHAVGVRVAQDLDRYRELNDERAEKLRCLIMDVTEPFNVFMAADRAFPAAGSGHAAAPRGADASGDGAGAESPSDALLREALANGIDEIRRENESLRAELSDRGVKARQLKAVEEKLRHVQERQAQIEQDRDAARRQADEAGGRVARAERARDDALAEINRLKARMEADVERRAAERQRAELHAWVGEARAAAAAARTDSGAGDLLERVSGVLARQREQDRHSGNLGQVRQRLSRLRTALDEVRAAAAEAIRPLPDLAALEQELDREIQQLVPIVEPLPARASPAAAAMAARINAAPDAEVEAIGRLLDDMAGARLLSGAEVDALYRLYHRRLDVLYLAAGPKVLAAAAAPDPFWRMQRSFGGAERMALLIDGHNALFLLDDLLGAYYEEGQPRARARQRLGGLTVRLTGAHPECDTTLFFDGPTEAHSTAAPNVKIVYSGGQGAHRADDAIVNQLKYYRGERQPRPRVVVTDDLDLRRRARETGAAIMPVRQFGALLADLVRDGAPPARGNGNGAPP